MAESRRRQLAGRCGRTFTAGWSVASPYFSSLCLCVSVVKSCRIMSERRGSYGLNCGRCRMTEFEKMLAGELYDSLDAELVALRRRARDLCQSLNQSGEAEEVPRR